jgi:HPt (histidine-containing phosphotransfer) domain-containing protein
LEELGSSPEFLERLINVFVADGASLLARMEQAVASRNCVEMRSLVHAMKGSSVSMGTERLTQACAGFENLTDAGLRLQAAGLMRALSEEFAGSQIQLTRYLRDKKKSAG